MHGIVDNGRLIFIGIDGASYEMIDRLAAEGTLPHIAQLIQGGTFYPMTSSLPEVSPVAWRSIITGADPAEHGTFGFTDLAPHSYRTTFTSSHTLAVPPFWTDARHSPAVVINMPFTYPAQPLDGVLIAGFVALDLKKATYPPSLLPELERINYRTDADSSKAHQSFNLFFNDLDRTLKARIAAYRYLWENEPWQTFALVFTGTDRLSHFLWNAAQDPSHAYHDAFVDHFRQVDEVLGEIAGRLQANDRLVVVSDHGFEMLHKNVYVNAILRDAGLLSFDVDEPRGMKHISPTAKAFALEPSRIYVHTAEKYPEGNVSESDREIVIQDVIALFQDLTYEGQPVISRAFRRDEIYHGPLIDHAPDVVLLAESGFNLSSSLKATDLFGDDVFTGKHARDNAIFLVYGDYEPDAIPQQPQVADVVGMIDQIMHHS